MPSHYAIDRLPLRPLFGTEFRPLSQKALVQRFSELGRESAFHLMVLGLAEPCSKEEFADLVAEGNIRAYVPKSTAADEMTAEPVVFVTTVVGIVLYASWPSEASSFDPQSFAEHLLVVAEAVFAVNPRCSYVMATLPFPLAALAEESLNGWGCEHIGRPSVDSHTKTFGIVRPVLAMVLQPLM